jgi:peptidoglycan/xylan/chitin deacetylase (PgdA/CDA1 family)
MVFHGARDSRMVALTFDLNGAPTAPETHAALPGIITGLRSKGLRLVKVSELLAAR